MTVQIKHTIIPDEEEGFSVKKYSGNPPFDISPYFTEPFMSFSACWRGFVATFTIKNTRLLLKDLGVFKEIEKPKIINGVTPNFIDFFDSKIPYYENIGLELAYTGRMLITNGYIKLGLSPIFDIASHENITELVFSSGILQEKEDLSGLIERFREDLFDHAKEECNEENSLKMLSELSSKAKIKKKVTAEDKENIKVIFQESKKLILTEKLSEVPRQITHHLFKNFKFKDDEFKKEFNQRFDLNYGHSPYDW